jgi:hypothetical protein
MPYGIAKRFGGDSPGNDVRMERQVSAIQRSGKGKVSAIKIAKAQQAKRGSVGPRNPKLAADALRQAAAEDEE